MNDIVIHTVPGFQTNPDGDMLGLKDFLNTCVESISSKISWYSRAWNDFQGCDVVHRWGKRNILIGQSYGCASIKRTLLHKTVKPLMFDLAIFLDPVPRWLWGQIPFFSWHCPTNILQSVVFYQRNFAPLGLPFLPRHNVIQFDVSNWEKKLYHVDIPGSTWVQQRMFRLIMDIVTDGIISPINLTHSPGIVELR